MSVTNSVFVIAILTATLSCSLQKGTQSKTPNATPSVDTTDLRRRWEEQVKQLDPAKLGKDYSGKRLAILEDLLRQLPAPEIKDQLETTRKLPGEYEQLGEYDQYLLQALFVVYATRNDRDTLVYLLSAKCPRFIGTSAIESEVASLRVQSPFLVLIDSYDRAENDQHRKYLSDIIRESLKDLSNRTADDAAFVKAARSWYIENLPSVKINPYYHPFVPFAEQRDLFVPKT